MMPKLMDRTIVFGYFYLIVNKKRRFVRHDRTPGMQDSAISKTGLTAQTSPRVNVITTEKSIVVLVLASGESGGFSSYSCPLLSRNIDRKDTPSN